MLEQELISRVLEPPLSEQKAGFLRQLLGRPGFLPCLALLTVFAVSYQVWSAVAQVQFKKLPLPLRRELDKLDQQKLFPYVLISQSILKPEMVDTLGTDQYISWMLRDTSVDTGGPEQYANLFVTYYTGKPSQVPHVPDVCYVGGGYRMIDSTLQEMSIPALGMSIPVKVLELEASQLLGREKKVVVYTFSANGQFAAERGEVQSIMADPFGHYAYFSKLEVTFGTQEHVPPRDVAVKAAERLFQVVVPMLVKEHWPDWKAANDSLKKGAPNSQPAHTL